jgi:hypothetical protein
MPRGTTAQAVGEDFRKNAPADSAHCPFRCYHRCTVAPFELGEFGVALSRHLPSCPLKSSMRRISGPGVLDGCSGPAL